MTIALATPADLPTVRDLAHRTWPATFSAILSPDQIAYMLERMYGPEALRAQVEERGHVFLLARDDAGEARAYVSYELDCLPGVTKVHKLYVLPDGHRGGTGRALVEAVADIARAAGQQALRLDVNRDNPAVGFYERLGFAKVDEVVTEIGEGYVMDDFVFEKNL